MRIFGNINEPAVFLNSGGDDNSLTVEVSNNHVYFYSDVNPDRCLDLIKKIRKLDEDLRNERVTRDLPEDFPLTPIWLHIFSYGGHLLSGFSTGTQIAQIQTPIYSIVEGCCASAATFISMSCTKRYIQSSAYMLIHQLSKYHFGKQTYQEMKDDVRMQDKLMAQMEEFYVRHSSVAEGEIKELLSRDPWFDAQECLKMGLVDEVL